MKEYWVNVYSFGLGHFWPDEHSADRYSSWTKPILYRLHIKMKL